MNKYTNNKRSSDEYEAYIEAWKAYYLARNQLYSDMDDHVDFNMRTPDGVLVRSVLETIDQNYVQLLQKEAPFRIGSIYYEDPIKRDVNAKKCGSRKLASFTKKIQEHTEAYQDLSKMVQEKQYAQKRLDDMFNNDRVFKNALIGAGLLLGALVCAGLAACAILAIPNTDDLRFVNDWCGICLGRDDGISLLRYSVFQTCSL